MYCKRQESADGVNILARSWDRLVTGSDEKRPQIWSEKFRGSKQGEPCGDVQMSLSEHVLRDLPVRPGLGGRHPHEPRKGALVEMRDPDSLVWAKLVAVFREDLEERGGHHSSRRVVQIHK